MKIGIVGAGTMAEAIIKGLLGKELCGPELLVASAPREERRTFLQYEYGIRTVRENVDAIDGASTVILCVKPQTAATVLPELRAALQPQQALVSIAAGVTLETLARGSDHQAVLRAMPNTPCLVGEGMTVWVASEATSERHLEEMRMIFGALGRQMQVSNESFLNMATSISGSGPSYLFLLMEAMTDAGVQIGLPRYMAEELVTQTVLGAARLAQETGRHPAALKNAVTSPGGTAAQALYHLEKGGLRSTMAEAVLAAYHRAQSLGKNEGDPR
ncbi:MAG TPA: pyrroline-5-carboxylate reductase [Chloroflexota bacterium]|nr:pyrroline-5-carboxylate reductase [Chloroflexota bacterium]